VIDVAADEARQLNHHVIGTEHLLLGVVQDESLTGDVLRSLGAKWLAHSSHGPARSLLSELE
jgi:hypothetical protein